MESIKIIIQRTVEPIKIVVYNFPRIFPTRATWNVIFKGIANAILVLRGKASFQNTFKGYAKVKLFLTGKSSFNIIFKGIAKAKLFLNGKAVSSPIFNGQANAQLNLIAHAVNQITFKGIANARTFIFKKWRNYSDTLKWSDLPDDMTIGEFIYTEIF